MICLDDCRGAIHGGLDRDTPPYRIDAGREDLGIPHNMGAWQCAVEAFVSEASLSRQQCVIRKTHLSQPVQSTNSRKISDLQEISFAFLERVPLPKPGIEPSA